MLRLLAIRVLAFVTVLAGAIYVSWRWVASVNWSAWWIAVPLVAAETYALVDGALFSITVWRSRVREAPPATASELTVDVFITTYDEPVELVCRTAVAAQAIRGPHRTWILDDGDRAELAAVAQGLGIGYVARGATWSGPRHAKAGNLNNALLQTDGDLVLVLDADQVPKPEILERTLGYFEDPGVALVQTPQWFENVADGDPLGSQAPLFYGPIQQGKDGWNAAFFCGSNAILRREALMQLGIVGYVEETERSGGRALRAADAVLARAARRAVEPHVAAALGQLRAAARHARRRLRRGETVAEVTYDFQEAVRRASRTLVASDAAAMRATIDALDIDALIVPDADDVDDQVVPAFTDDAITRLAERDWSPLGALEAVSAIVRRVDVDRAHEAQPVMPLATISVTEDMATSMRLHALGWRSVYHDEVLAVGLAPEDLRSALTQRIRWAQGTLQVLLRDNPLTKRGLRVGQRLMYFATMWSYLSGFAAVAFLTAPVVYLCFDVRPVDAYNVDFLARFLPFVVANQLLFLVVGHGKRTWRGQQYSLALFPLWIRAAWTAFANVVLRRPLAFAVTPKTRQVRSIPWRLLWVQVVVAAALAVSTVVGVVRLAVGATDSVAGTVVNIVWVVYDLVLLSVLVRAARSRRAVEEVVDEQERTLAWSS